jgi:hypothetical protein
MALFGPQAKLYNCLWWADMASFPNPESERGLARRERCFDKYMRTATEGQATMVKNGNSRIAMAGGAPIMQQRNQQLISPLGQAITLPPRETPAPTATVGYQAPKFPWIWLFIAVVAIMVMYKS